jgi:GNAT superfamily N-acetyltransferase
MCDHTAAPPVDPLLVKGWLTARSIARGLPAPVDDSGGWRVDTHLPTETRRYVFANVTGGLQKIAESISSPLIFLKLCGSEAAMRAALPPRWTILTSSYFMTLDGEAYGPRTLPPGYEMEIYQINAVIAARVLTKDGALAASGYAAEAEGVFVYDRIVTEPPHRRRGLGSAVMQALGARRRSNDARQALVATEEGRGLYRTLGWAVRSPYTTAVISSF